MTQELTRSRLHPRPSSDPDSHRLPQAASTTLVSIQSNTSKQAKVVAKPFDPSPGSSRSSTPSLRGRMLSKAQSHADVRTAPRRAFEKTFSQPDLKRTKSRKNFATSDTALRPGIDRMLEASEKKGGLRHIPCATVRFVEGIVDVSIVKPVGILLATAGGALFLTLAILTLFFTGCGLSKKGRAVSAGFAQVALNHLKIALFGLGWILFTVITGIPRYISERACAQSYKLFTKSILSPIERRFRSKNNGHFIAKANISKSIVEKVRTSRYMGAVGFLTGVTAFSNALLLNGHLSPAAATPSQEKYAAPVRSQPAQPAIRDVSLVLEPLDAADELEMHYLDPQ